MYNNRTTFFYTQYNIQKLGIDYSMSVFYFRHLYFTDVNMIGLYPITFYRIRKGVGECKKVW